MNAYSRSLSYLYNLQDRGMKFGLHNIKGLLAAVGNPERRLHAIHIAGTNGKGSTAAFLSSISMEAGYTTGLYTSPHLVRFNERIRVNGRPISDASIVRYVRLMKKAIEDYHATFFEATTCMAFLYFADRNVDLAVIEAGLGGRLDSTNVLTPLVSVITNVSFDHTQYLGNTLAAIAREKGGIIKVGVPCVTGSHDPTVLRTLRGLASRRNARLYVSWGLARMRRERKSREVSFHTRRFSAEASESGLQGSFQHANLRLALATLELLMRSRRNALRFKGLTPRAIRYGIRKVRKNSGLRGRFERLSRRGLFLLDVAHNPSAVATFVNDAKKAGLENTVVVFGVMKDKDVGAMLDTLKPVCRVLIPVAPRLKRALSVPALSRIARAKGIYLVEGGTVSRGVRMARKMSRRGEEIVVTGSHYVVGDALKYILHEGA